MYNTTYFEKYHDVQLTSLSLKYRGFCQGKKMPPHFAYTKNLPIFRSIEGEKKELENGRENRRIETDGKIIVNILAIAEEGKTPVR